jgi:hypothetical protein
VSGTERPAGWFRMVVRGLDWLVAALVAVGGSLIVSGLVLALVPEPARPTEAFRVIALFLCGLGLMFAGAATGAASDRLWRGLSGERGTGFLVLSAASLMALGLMLAVEVNADLRVGHAPIGLLSAVLLVASLVMVSRTFRVIAAQFALDPIPRPGRLVPATIVSIAGGAVLSFVPIFLENVTPRECAIRIGGITALSIGLPALFAIGPLRRFRRAVADAADAADWCPACGYPRPPATRCPECGHVPATFPRP